MRKKILLVDDDPVFLALAEFAIKKEKPTIEIHKAQNGEEAIELLQREQIDIILLDLNMPVMNGWDFLYAEAQREKKEEKIYILTSSIDPSDKKKAKENPRVLSMLEKPLDPKKVDILFAPLE